MDAFLQPKRNPMASFTLKNMPPLVFERLKIRAKNDSRNINNELLTLVEQSVMNKPLSSSEINGIAKKYQKELGDELWCLHEINDAKKFGRE